jgi:hypothetical protein
MPLQVPRAPIITADRRRHHHAAAGRVVSDQYATMHTNPITGRLNVLGMVGSK